MRNMGKKKKRKLVMWCTCKVIGCLLFSVGSVFWGCSVPKYYSVSGTFQKQTAQGMAVFKDYAFLFNNTGICRIYDLNRQCMVNYFDVASKSVNNHANCVSFGVEYFVGNKDFPALYISECKKPWRCFVEDVSLQGAKLMQIFQFKRDNKEEIVHNWVVDKERNFIYAIARKPSANGSDYVHSICCFQLPSIHEKNVIFTERDIKDDFQVLFPNLLQGACIRNGFLYMPTGMHAVSGNNKSGKREIMVIDLKQKLIKQKICLTNITVNEPEDVDFYRRKLLLYCGQTGGLYCIDL